MRKRLIIVAISFLFFGCSNQEDLKQKIGATLGISLREIDINSIHHEKKMFMENYEHPSNEYIKFSVKDDSDFYSFIKKLNVSIVDDSLKRRACLELADGVFFRSLLSFQTNLEAKRSSKGLPAWWNPDSIKGNRVTYFSFYNSRGLHKTEPCYLKKWDGRVLISYDFSNKDVFMLISTFM